MDPSPIRLERMTDAAVADYLNTLVRAYAADHVRAGNWAAEGAEERARRQTLELLPDGGGTAGHDLFDIVERGGGRRVGVLWLALRSDEGRRDLFIYDIEIAAAYRRRGFARAALAAAEERARRLGVDRLVLHVFADNEGARALYRGAGFAEVDVIMAKPVSAAGSDGDPAPGGAAGSSEGAAAPPA